MMSIENPEAQEPAKFSDEQTEGKEFTPTTDVELADFVSEIGGDSKKSLRDGISSILGRQSVDRRYPELQEKNLDTYILFVGQSAIGEASNFAELLEKGTVYNGVPLSTAGLDRYRLARLEWHQAYEKMHGQSTGEAQ